MNLSQSQANTNQSMSKKGRPRNRSPTNAIDYQQLPDHWSDNQRLIYLLGLVCELGSFKFIATGKRAGAKYMNDQVKNMDKSTQNKYKKEQKRLRKQFQDQVEQIKDDTLKYYGLSGTRDYFLIKQTTNSRKKSIIINSLICCSCGSGPFQKLVSQLNMITECLSPEFIKSLQLLLDAFFENQDQVIERWLIMVAERKEDFKELLACEKTKQKCQTLAKESNMDYLPDEGPDYIERFLNEFYRIILEIQNGQ